MCGIAALLGLRGAPVEPGYLVAAAHSLAHRGPDDEGFVLAGRSVPPRRLGSQLSKAPGLEPIDTASPTEGYTVGLMNRRLAIIDLTAAGHGPMGSADGAVWLTYNGEVYNYRELASQLRARGHIFSGHSDTEVVLAAYLEWGESFVERLNGMFAFAIWDARSQELLLGRDRLGIKPLYVSDLGAFVAAASEPKALLACGVRTQIDWETAYAYLVAGYTDWSDRTFLLGIRQLEPATIEVFSGDGRRRSRRYWSATDAPPFDGSRNAAVARFRDLFLDSVRLQLRSDVPIGTALSGGLDSSSIVAASAAVGDASAARYGFSAVFDSAAVDESRYARAVARRYDLDWHTVRPSETDLLADLDQLLSAQGEPVPSSSSYAQWRVMRLAREHAVTVLLDGQGGDELLAGYSGFRPYVVADAVRRGRFVTATRELWSAHAQASLAPVAARSVAALAPQRLVGSGRARARRRATGYVSPQLHERYAQRLREAEEMPATLAGVLHRSLTRMTLPALLRSEDRSSMAHSREARVPFLDHRLVEHAASLPVELKVAGGRTKVVLREALGDLLPPEILARRDKVGFATPEAGWLRSLGESLVGDVLRNVDDGLDRDGAFALWSRLRHGDDAAAAPLWRLVCFERWRKLICP